MTQAQNLTLDTTLVIVTSALFADGSAKRLAIPSPFRIERINRSVSSMAGYGFTNFLLLDNTLPEDFDLSNIFGFKNIKFNLCKLEKAVRTFEGDEFHLKGPSRLEALLLKQALPHIESLKSKYQRVLKVSAGYEVLNLNNILPKIQGGLIYRMGNPFRTKIKFCLTSFYVLPIPYFSKLCNYFYAELDQMSNLEPLEYHLYKFVNTQSRQLVSIQYPLLKANFLTTGRSSADLNYRIKEQIFILLAWFGLYAYRIK